MSNNTQWLEISIKTNHEIAEAISEAIYPYVEGGVAMEQINTDDTTIDRWEDEVAKGPVIVRGYLPLDGSTEERRQKVEYALRCLNLVLPVPLPTYRTIANSDWSEAWKVAFKPLHIGKHIMVRPSWIEIAPEPGDIVISLDPGLAFGTGLHPTTQLCAMALEELVKPGMRVLDVGSGSALLSILAARLGANEVLGVDIDEEAVRVSRENIQKNDVQRQVQIEAGSFERGTGVYDIVVANILAGVITKMIDNGLTRFGRRFVFSGILEAQTPQVKDAISRSGMRLTEIKQISDWACLVCEASVR